MVHDAADVLCGPAMLDSVRVVFDEPRLVSDAGLLVTATLAERLGVEALVNESVWLGYRTPGGALPGRKVMSLVHGMLAGADRIDQMDVLRAGSTGLVLGHRVMAPSTLGTFLRAFTFGHVRQLDRVLDVALARAWDMGAGPGEMPLVIDIDSFIGEVCSDRKQGAGYGYTRQLSWGITRSSPCALIPVRCCTSATARGRPTRSAAPRGSWMSCSRTRVVGAQAELWPDWRHHAFATNRTARLLVADVDHRDHATIGLIIRDLKDQALAHFPTGQMHANSAWTVIAALAHNLGRQTTLIGLPDRPVQTARSRRRHRLQIPARLARTSRTWTLRMPARWPWQTDFTTVLDAIRKLPARA